MGNPNLDTQERSEFEVVLLGGISLDGIARPGAWRKASVTN